MPDANKCQNIAKAQKEIERLDAEESANGTSATNGDKEPTIMEGISSEIEKVKGAVSDIVADLNGASISATKEDQTFAYHGSIMISLILELHCFSASYGLNLSSIIRFSVAEACLICLSPTLDL